MIVRKMLGIAALAMAIVGVWSANAYADSQPTNADIPINIDLNPLPFALQPTVHLIPNRTDDDILVILPTVNSGR